MRIALIHALSHSVAPINAVMAAQWPDAIRMNLLDDSLSADLARAGQGLDAAMHQRFLDLSAYAVGTQVDGILFTCSAFGPCIDAVKARYPHLPVFKPNEAMITQAEAHTHEIGLIASFAGTLETMPSEFGAHTQLQTALVAEALDALNRGDVDAHDAAVLAAAQRLVQGGAKAIALAQFSMARAAPLVRQHVGVPVFTTPESAVHALKLALGVPAA
jgi:Asp/Glu/hydantoin racemase